jgi:ribosomal protein S18 acetylase RimI-like enzyme
MELEHRVFATDRLSRRSLRHLLHAPTAEVLVAEEDGRFAGTAIVLFRAGSRLARLYSVAVAPHMGGRGIASLLLEAAEDRARTRKCWAIRLEVHETNHRAVSRYRKSGYREFGRHPAYYEDGGDALRFEKPITRKAPGPRVRNPSSK